MRRLCSDIFARAKLYSRLPLVKFPLKCNQDRMLRASGEIHVRVFHVKLIAQITEITLWWQMRQRFRHLPTLELQ
eukprot:SAG31_NODE_18503_length_633_cov_2.144195_1_plen_74_part_10